MSRSPRLRVGRHWRRQLRLFLSSALHRMGDRISPDAAVSPLDLIKFGEVPSGTSFSQNSKFLKDLANSAEAATRSPN